MNSKFLLLLFLVLSFKAFAYERDFALKAGISLAQSHLKYIDSSEDDAIGFGFNTNFGYRYTKWEFNLTSFIALGEMERLTYQLGQTRVQGEGSFNHASFGPSVRYYFDYAYRERWRLYVSPGPVWSINTFKLEDFTVDSGNFREEYRYSYLSRGWFITVGVEELLPSKVLKPAFIEILAAYQTAYNVAILDNSDFKEVLTLQQDKVRTNIYTATFMLNIGIVIF